MSWTQPTKIQSEVKEVDLTTPDGQKILVGASQDQVLYTVAPSTNWTLPIK